MDSKSQWEFIGLETLVMRDAAKIEFNIQKDFENAQTLSHDHAMGMER